MNTVGKFHWLLDPEQAALLKDWTKQLLGGLNGTAGGASSSTDPPTGKSKKAEDKNMRNNVDATSLVDSFF